MIPPYWSPKPFAHVLVVFGVILFDSFRDRLWRRRTTQLQQTNVQIKAVSQRIRNFDEQRSVELAEEEEAQTRGRRQLCYFAVLVAVGLVALAIWALTSQ